MKRPKVLLTQPYCDSAMALMRERADVTLGFDLTPDQLREKLRDFDVLMVRITRVDAQLIEANPQLVLISKTGVGVDSIDVDVATQMGIPVTNTPGANANAVAEYTVAGMLALSRRIFWCDQMMREGREAAERYEYLGDDLFGKELLLVGFGNIGKKVAAICRAMEMKVSVYDAFVKEAEVRALGCNYVTDLDLALAQADVVSLHVPLTNETKNLIDARRIALMKQGAYLINNARGGIVDEQALADALNTGYLAGAASDVFSTEPCTMDNPLMSARNLIVSPHIAGVTQGARDAMSMMAVQRMLAAYDGDRTIPVNPTAYLHARWK